MEEQITTNQKAKSPTKETTQRQQTTDNRTNKKKTTQRIKLQKKHGEDEVPTSKYLVSCSNRLSSACILCFPLVSEEDKD